MADIAVWVKGREKLLTGVSRTTTCQDIVKTLLKDKVSKRFAENFALCERWRDCERQLAPQTRVYKLWKAWGSEQENVKFVLKKYTPNDKSVKIDALRLKEENTGKMWKSRAKRKHTDQKRREKGLTVREGNSHKHDTAYRNSRYDNRDIANPECQEAVRNKSARSSEPSELIPSDICGPEMIRKDDATQLPTSLLNLKKNPSSETFNQLVQLVVRQSQQLEELLQQAQDIDREIEFYETKMHLLRVEENGKNYVQDAYLAHDEETESKMAEIIAGLYHSGGNDELEKYIDLYERIIHVEEQLNEKQSTITSLSRQIEEQRCSPSQCVESVNCSQGLSKDTLTSTPVSSTNLHCERLNQRNSPYLNTDTVQGSSALEDEIGFARAQLEKSAQTCVAQKTELSTMQKRLQATETLLDDKCHWMRVLAVELQRLRETEKRMMMSSAEMTSSNDKHREEKRLQELLQLVRQPLQPIQETSEEEEADDTDVISQITNDNISRFNKLVLSDDASSDTGLSSLHSQDEPEPMLFEIIMETLV